MAWSTHLFASARRFGAALLFLEWLSGCYPEHAAYVAPEKHEIIMPEPNGTFVHRFQELQAGKAEAADFVFFADEWYKGGPKLGPHGRYHLTHLLPRLGHETFPVVVQASGDEALDAERRRFLVEALINHGVADADVRVIIAYPDAEGLYGEQAECIFHNMLHPYRGAGLNPGVGLGLYGGGIGGLGGTAGALGAYGYR